MNFSKLEFLCGSLFKDLCMYSVQDYLDARNHRYCFKVSSKGDPRKVFVKTEYLKHFITHNRIDREFDLVTHNSDINISDKDYDSVKESLPNMGRWYCQNLNGFHSDLKGIPIGIANPKWEHGNQETLKKVQQSNLEKSNLIYTNFDIYTNPKERQFCLDNIGLEMSDRVPFEDHLRKLGSSFFCISPNGNGIDCHRHWEALYLNTIPIVTRSPTITFFQNMGIPFLVIDDWTQFSSLKIDENLYNELIGDFSPKDLHYSNFLYSCDL